MCYDRHMSEDQEVIPVKKIGDIILYSGEVGKTYWNTFHNQSMIEFLNYLLNGGTIVSGCDGLSNIHHIYLLYDSVSSFELLGRSEESPTSYDEDDFIFSDEFSNIVSRIKAKHKDKHFCLREIFVHSKSGYRHTVNSGGCASVPSPEYNEPLKENISDESLQEFIDYFTKYYKGEVKLIKELNGIKIFQVY